MINKLPLALFFLLSACSSDSYNITSQDADIEAKRSDFVLALEQAHRASEFNKKGLVNFDIVIYFGGRERLNSHVTLSTDSRMGKFENSDGEELIYRDGEVFYSEGYGSEDRARFAAYTWSYFFLLPFKTSDPGTIWSEYQDESPLGEKSDAKKLTFEEGIGDAPDDWYIIYSDKPSGLMDVAAYIVTAGASIEEAEKDPHAIEYENYDMVDGIPLARNWTFWSWRETEGLVDTLGWAELNNFRFSAMNEALFSAEGLNKSMN